MHRNIKILLASSILIHSGINLFAPLYAVFIKDIGGTLFIAGSAIGLYAILRGILHFFLAQVKEHTFRRKDMIISGYNSSILFLPSIPDRLRPMSKEAVGGKSAPIFSGDILLLHYSFTVDSRLPQICKSR